MNGFVRPACQLPESLEIFGLGKSGGRILKFTRQLRSALVAALLSIAVPVLAKAPPPLEAYGDLPAVEDMAISPSGQGLAIVSRIKGERQLVITGQGGELRMMAPLADTKVRGIRWAGEDIVVLTNSVTENLSVEFTARQTETFGAIVLTLENQKAAMVFENRSSITNAIFGEGVIRNVDGKWKGFFPGLELKRNPGSQTYTLIGSAFALYAVDLAHNQPSKVVGAKDAGYYEDWIVDENGKVAVTLEWNTGSGKWTILNVTRTTIASGTDPTGDIGLVALGRTGSTIIYSVEDDSSGETSWFEVPLAGGEPKEVLADIGISEIFVDSRNGRMLGYLDRDTGRPVMFDPAQQAVLSKVYQAFRNLNVSIEGWSPDLNHILLKTSGNRDSGTWFKVDMTKMQADPIGNVRPRIGPDQVGPISTVTYIAQDGLDLDGILTLPPGREARNLPVIMFPHGGPRSHDEAEFDWWAQAFASRGFAVFQPNFRGSTNRDDAFRRAGYGQWGRKMQTDLSDGLAELVRLGIADPKRACIMGASYGGYATLAGVTLQQGLYRCAVAVAPVADLHDFYWEALQDSGYDKALKRSWQESLGDTSTLDEVSPRRFADSADAPILLIHGTDDTVVPIKQSEAMAHALKRADKPYELVILKHEDHWLSHAETRKQMLEEAMRFVQKYNPAD